MKIIGFALFGILAFSSFCNAQTVSDIDGNIYNIITIGNQEWTKENLRTAHFSNGDIINTTSLAVYNDTSAVYQWAYNEDTSIVNSYGRLYSWYCVIDSRNVCPSGWHVPNDSDWMYLNDFLGGANVAGGTMKEIGLSHWNTTDSTVTNSSGFTALPGGFRGNPSGFANMGSKGTYWSTTQFGSGGFARGDCFVLQANNSQLMATVAVGNCGFSVRCLRNSASGLEQNINRNEIQLFPNPTTNTIVIKKEDSRKSELLIYNSIGDLIINKELSELMTTIDVGGLPNGVYMVVVVGVDFRIERKLIKSR